MRDRSGHTEYMREWRAKKHSALKANSSIAKHGKASTYNNYGCRCKPCLADKPPTKKGRRRTQSPEYHVAATGKSRRRITPVDASRGRQAWTSADMAIATECDKEGEYIRSAFDVAQVIGRTIMAVERKRAKMKVREDQREAAGNPTESKNRGVKA